MQPIFTSLLMALLFCSCQSNKIDFDPNNLLSGLSIESPGKTWRAYQRPHIQSWFKANRSETDEDLIALYVEAVVPAATITGDSDAAKLLSISESLGWSKDDKTVSLEQDFLGNIAVLRRHSYGEDKGGASQEILRLLGINRRESREAYFRRNKSILLLHPDSKKKDQLAIQVGITRSSAHGLVGEVYEDQALDFINAFLNANYPAALQSPESPQ